MDMFRLLFISFLFFSLYRLDCSLSPCVAPDFNVSCCCVSPCLETQFTAINPVSSGVWTLLSHFYFDGLFEINNRMIIIAVCHSSERFLVLINGDELCPNTLNSLKQMEKDLKLPIKHIISPGDWHYLYLPKYLIHFPNALIHIPPGRIQRQDPVNSKYYHLINMTDPLPFLRPTIITIPFEGLQQGPGDWTWWFTHRNEFLFYLEKNSLLIAGDTLFYEKCNTGNVNGQITFNPQGIHMIANVSEAIETAQLILSINFTNFINIHGMLGSMLINQNDPKPLIKSALSFLYEK